MAGAWHHGRTLHRSSANLFLADLLSTLTLQLVTERSRQPDSLGLSPSSSGLTVIPVAAAYAALVQRTLDVRLVIRAAIQYLLARSFILFISLMPFMLLLVMVALNRNRSVADLLSGGQGLLLATLAVAGLRGRRGPSALDGYSGRAILQATS